MLHVEKLLFSVRVNSIKFEKMKLNYIMRFILLINLFIFSISTQQGIEDFWNSTKARGILIIFLLELCIFTTLVIYDIYKKSIK